MNKSQSIRIWPYPGLVVIVLELVLMVVHTSVIAFNTPFVSLLPANMPTQSSRNHRYESVAPLYTSLTIPSESRSSDFDEDNGTNVWKRRNVNDQHDIKIEKYDQNIVLDDSNDEYEGGEVDVFSAQPNDDSSEMPARHRRKVDPFLAYLNGMVSAIHRYRVLANKLDDEVKRMEIRYFELNGDDMPIIRYPLSLDGRGYNKKPRRPSLEVYELVAWAYSKSDLGVEGALLAEEVFERYQMHNPKSKASMKLMASIMKAWLEAKDLERSVFWLRRIESEFQPNPEEYQCDNGHQMLPGYAVYHPFVVGLQKMRKGDFDKIADLSVEAIERLRANRLLVTSGTQAFFPSSDTYRAAIKNIKRSDHNPRKVFNRIESLLSTQREDYHLHCHEQSKADVKQIMPLFVAAARCSYPKDAFAVQKCEKLLEDYRQLYIDTGDRDFRPTPRMYERMLDLFARSNRRQNPHLFYERTRSLLRSMKDLGVEFDMYFVATAALNRVMQTAENCMKEDPTTDPVATRDLFQICLDTFKLYKHSIKSEPTDFLAAPNDSTYQIFLRACSHLPEGQSRWKLSAKAFQICESNNLVSAGVLNELFAANPDLAEKAFCVTKENTN